MRRFLILAVLVCLPAGVPAEAARPPGDTIEITVTPEGLPADGEPDGCSSQLACGATGDLSADGRFVAFATPFSTILPGDLNGEIDVFVRDTLLGVTELVSVAADGGWADAASSAPSISADGRYVAFMSLASNLTPVDGDGIDVFVRDRLLQKTTIESIGPDGRLPGFQGVDDAVLSDNGRVLVFQSGGFSDDVTNDPRLPFGGINFTNTYRRDLDTGTTTMVSLTHDGRRSTSVDITLDENAIDADGSVIAFGSQRHDLVPGDTNAQSDIFVADLEAGTLERVSVASDGTQANWISYQPALSADGRFVSFSSAANNLVPVDTTSSRVPVASITGGGAAPDVFVHDRLLETTERVSVTSSGLEPGDAYFNDLSDDGRIVIFSSARGDYDGDTEFVDRIWIHDRATGQTDLVSVTSDGAPMAAAFAATISLSGDGTSVVFAGPSTSTPYGDAVYLHRRPGVARPVRATVDTADGVARVSGLLRLPGAEIASIAREPASDAPQLVSLSLTARPELGDVLIQGDIHGFPGLGLPVPAGPYLGPGRRPMAPAGFEIAITDAGGSSLEILPALDADGDGAFGGTRCAETCEPVIPLEGSLGVVGSEFRVAVPVGVLDGLSGALSVEASLLAGDAPLILQGVEVPAVAVDVRAGEGPWVAAEVDVSARSTFVAELAAGSDEPIIVRACLRTCSETRIR